MFIGRERELKTLNDAFNSPRRTAVLVYGKRRVGKSRLIEHASRSFDGLVINHLCAKTTYQGNLSLLCRSIAQAMGIPQFEMQTIFDIFDYLKEQAKLREKPILVVLDEYQYFKDSLRSGEVDSYMQGVIDSLPSTVKVVLCGSYITVMKELLEEGNPLFGRFTATILLREFDYWDASRFYADLPVRDKIARYAVFGGSPFVLENLQDKGGLKEVIQDYLIPSTGLLRTHIEQVMLAEIRKAFDVRILYIMGNGKNRYSDIASQLGGDANGLLGKQLKVLLDMETIEKTAPINEQASKKKTFYSIRDNLMRFYFSYLFANEGLTGRIGEAALYDTLIEPTITTFISLRFEGIVAQYFSRLARLGKLPGVQDIGTYRYDDPKKHKNGQFDCVIKRNDAYEFYEAKYYRHPMGLAECQQEERQVRELVGIDQVNVGFVCSAGFEADVKEGYTCITGDDLYMSALG